MWFGDEGIGDGLHGYLGSEKAVPAQEVPGLGRPQDQFSRALILRPSLLKRSLVWADRRIKARENWQGSDPDWLRPVIVMGPIISLGVLIVSWPARPR